MRGTPFLVLIALLGAPQANAQGREVLAGPPDAKFRYEERTYVVQISPREGELNIRLTFQAGLGQALLTDLSLQTYGGAPYERWARAVNKFLEPTGCERLDLMPIRQKDSWRFTYKCPNGVELVELIKSQRTALLKGEPIMVTTESTADVGSGE